MVDSDVWRLLWVILMGIDVYLAFSYRDIYRRARKMFKSVRTLELVLMLGQMSLLVLYGLGIGVNIIVQLCSLIVANNLFIILILSNYFKYIIGSNKKDI